MNYAATGHLPGKPSGSALVVVTDQAVRIAQLCGNLRVRERWQSPIGEVLGAIWWSVGASACWTWST